MAGSIGYKPSIVAAVNVRDFAAATAWYNDVLGFPTVYVMDEMKWGEFSSGLPGFHIGLMEDAAGAGVGGATITLEVEDIAAARAALEARGVAFEGPTDEMSGMVKLATFKDPDGNPFMLSQTLQQGS